MRRPSGCLRPTAAKPEPPRVAYRRLAALGNSIASAWIRFIPARYPDGGNMSYATVDVTQVATDTSQEASARRDLQRNQFPRSATRTLGIAPLRLSHRSSPLPRRNMRASALLTTHMRTRSCTGRHQALADRPPTETSALGRAIWISIGAAERDLDEAGTLPVTRTGANACRGTSIIKRGSGGH